MTSLAPPISIHLTRRQLRWLDSRRLRSSLSRSAVLREAIDALIQQEEGTGSTAGACRSGQAVPGPRQLELTASSTPAAEG
jgi:Arc/MetJ-type ribon-helix-helix transcriptional regulator